jgi:hypothetical protein
MVEEVPARSEWKELVNLYKLSGMDPRSVQVLPLGMTGVDHSSIPNLKTYQITLNLGF